LHSKTELAMTQAHGIKAAELSMQMQNLVYDNAK
jgi:hypothetical protein